MTFPFTLYFFTYRFFCTYVYSKQGVYITQYFSFSSWEIVFDVQCTFFHQMIYVEQQYYRLVPMGSDREVIIQNGFCSNSVLESVDYGHIYGSWPVSLGNGELVLTINLALVRLSENIDVIYLYHWWAVWKQRKNLHRVGCKRRYTSPTNELV